MLNFVTKLYYKLFPTNTHKIPKTIRQYVTLYGSRRYGVHHNKSDVDLLANIADFGHISSNIGIEYRVIKNSYIGIITGLSFISEGLTYNISFLNEKDYNISISILRILDCYYLDKENCNSKDKRKRDYIYLFELLNDTGPIVKNPSLKKFVINRFPELLL